MPPPASIPDLRRWLLQGGLNSDGLAPQVAHLATGNPELVEELASALEDDLREVRAHAADALERVSRLRSNLLEPHLPRLIALARNDPVAMVRWHMVMILGVLARKEEHVDRLAPVLKDSLKDSSAFVRAWGISSLCLVGRRFPRLRAGILSRLVRLQRDKSRAVRTRAHKAVELLADSRSPIPASWNKVVGSRP